MPHIIGALDEHSDISIGCLKLNIEAVGRGGNAAEANISGQQILRGNAGRKSIGGKVGVLVENLCIEIDCRACPVTGDVTVEYLQRLEEERCDAAKARRNGDASDADDDPQKGELTAVPFAEDDTEDDEASETAVGM